MPPIFWVSFGVVWGLVVLQGLVMLELVRQINDLRQRRVSDPSHSRPEGPLTMEDALGIGGDIPPALTLRDATTSDVTTWHELLPTAGLSAVVFLSPTCTTCWAVARGLEQVRATGPPKSRLLALVSAQKPGHADEFIARTGIGEFAVVEEGEAVEEALNVLRKPAVALLRGRTVTSIASVLEANDVLTVLRLADKHSTVQQQADGHLAAV